MKASCRQLVSLLAVSALVLSACGRRAILTPLASPAAATADATRTATLSEIVNDVKARPTLNDALTAVTEGFVLGVGGQIKTGPDSKARLDFNDGTVVRIAADSSFSLQAITPQADGLLSKIKLEAGKIWVSLTGGELQVETPVGVASVRGSFAVFEYNVGDPNNPDDDTLTLSCLEGECGAENDTLHETLGNLEQITLTKKGGQAVVTLSGAAVAEFLQNNPEGQRISATLTAAAPTDTPTSTATNTEAAGNQATATPSAATPTTLAPTNTLTPTPVPTATNTQTGTHFRILGQHVVQSGETLFCIGRAYGVLPSEIEQTNGVTTIFPGQVLLIPAAQWVNIPLGPVCVPQFDSPFPNLADATSTASAATQQAAIATATPTDTPAPPQPPADTDTPVPPTATFSPLPTATNVPTLIPTNTLPPPATSTFTPLPTNTSTATATSTATPTAPPTPTIPPTVTNTPTPTSTPDIVGPTISAFNASPITFTGGTATPFPACTVTFLADITDPSGVGSATVDWSASYFSTTTSGSAPMSLVTGITWQAVTTVSIPNGGTLSWTVTARDTVATPNVTGPVAGSPNVTTDFTNACP